MVIDMARKTISLSIDEEIYEAYKKYCEENSLILSRKVETFMKEELEKGGRRKRTKKKSCFSIN
ncbi:MAG: hypothetical protein J7K08_01870 [Thermoplasmata archaeon]|nr:hypothetical protein [Thermoplasmata archaeon]